MDPARDESFLISQMDFAVQYYKTQGTDHIDPARPKLLEAAERLTAALTPPEEVILRHSYEVSCRKSSWLIAFEERPDTS